MTEDDLLTGFDEPFCTEVEFKVGELWMVGFEGVPDLSGLLSKEFTDPFAFLNVSANLKRMKCRNQVAEVFHCAFEITISISSFLP